MNSPPSSSAAPAEKSLSSDGEAETSNLVEKRISKQLQTFLKPEVERVQSEIESALAGIKIIIETIAPWVRAVSAGANIESAQFRRRPLNSSPANGARDADYDADHPPRSGPRPLGHRIGPRASVSSACQQSSAC